jgi:hypothetical protein
MFRPVSTSFGRSLSAAVAAKAAKEEEEERPTNFLYLPEANKQRVKNLNYPRRSSHGIATTNILFSSKAWIEMREREREKREKEREREKESPLSKVMSCDVD